MTCECMREPDPGVCEGPCSLPSTGHCRCLTGCDHHAIARTVEEWQTELERTEGDLAVAVHEAMTARAQRLAVLDVADALIAERSTAGAGVIANRIRAAAGAAQPEEEQ